jgi:hypothetical protein
MNPLIVPGLKVRILQSNENWAEEMNEYVGYIVTVREANEYAGTRRTEVRFAEADDKYPGLSKWHWVYEQGHFEIFDGSIKDTPITKIKLNRKLKLKLTN